MTQIFSTLLFLAIAGGIAVWAAARGPKGRPSAATLSEIKPVLNEYCYGCHNEQKQKGGLSLESYRDAKAIQADDKTWKEVLRRVRAGEMPPESKPQPSMDQRNRLAAWIEAQLFPVDCDNPDPGRVTIRRLNRVEYNNTVRDLVGVAFSPADDFPADDSGYGFDNIGDALSVSPLLLEKYLAAAERILDSAIVDENSFQPPRKSFTGDKLKNTQGGAVIGGHVFGLSSQGEAYVEDSLDPGRYVLKVRAFAEQAGPEKARMALMVDGQERQTVEVKAKERSPAEYRLDLTLAEGKHRFGGAFLNDYYNPEDPDPRNRDRNLFIESIEITGPLDPPPLKIPDTHRRIFTCTPREDTTNQCSRTIIADFTRRAYRRPVTPQEVNRLAALAAQARKDGESFEGSIKISLQAVMVSPHFLFRGELQPEPDNFQTRRPLDDFALASRLSYFLWSSMPDEKLFALAQKKQIRKNLPAEVRRMLQDPKSLEFVENFGGQWLQIRNLDLMQPDSEVFTAFDPGLRKAMRTETELFLGSMIKEDKSLIDLLAGEYTFLNERLARHYGIAGVHGTEFRKVSLKGTGRAGVLTHASVLTISSNPTRTSPVKRGKWVLENLLAQAPPPPPPNVPPLDETKQAAAGASLRQRMEQHREDPMCSSCHSVMDPVGFSLEHFDGIGAWRDNDGAFPIDASGLLPSGEKFEGAKGLVQLISNGRRDQFVRCLAQKALTYALGRGLEHYDRCALEKITERVARNEYRFSVLILAVVESVPFQMRRGDGSSQP
jgi:hypothetical protein